MENLLLIRPKPPLPTPAIHSRPNLGGGECSFRYAFCSAFKEFGFACHKRSIIADSMCHYD